MALHVVLGRNKYFPRGSWVEDFEMGGLQVMQRVRPMKDPDTGRWEAGDYLGIAIPAYKVSHDCIRIQKRGLDNHAF